MEFENQYLSFVEYTRLGGKLSVMPFNILEFEARKIIDKRTQNRLVGVKDLPQEVKMCMFALINTISNYNAKNENVGISSETTDGYSISYSNVTRETISTKILELQDIVSNYLIGVVVNNEHILYLGVV
jgi:hypothetical protein